MYAYKYPYYYKDETGKAYFMTMPQEDVFPTASFTYQHTAYAPSEFALPGLFGTRSGKWTGLMPVQQAMLKERMDPARFGAGTAAVANPVIDTGMFAGIMLAGGLAGTALFAADMGLSAATGMGAGDWIKYTGSKYLGGGYDPYFEQTQKYLMLNLGKPGMPSVRTAQLMAAETTKWAASSKADVNQLQEVAYAYLAGSAKDLLSELKDTLMPLIKKKSADSLMTQAKTVEMLAGISAQYGRQAMKDVMDLPDFRYGAPERALSFSSQYAQSLSRPAREGIMLYGAVSAMTGGAAYTERMAGSFANMFNTDVLLQARTMGTGSYMERTRAGLGIMGMAGGRAAAMESLSGGRAAGEMQETLFDMMQSGQYKNFQAAYQAYAVETGTLGSMTHDTIDTMRKTYEYNETISSLKDDKSIDSATASLVGHAFNRPLTKKEAITASEAMPDLSLETTRVWDSGYGNRSGMTGRMGPGDTRGALEVVTKDKYRYALAPIQAKVRKLLTSPARHERLLAMKVINLSRKTFGKYSGRTVLDQKETAQYGSDMIGFTEQADKILSQTVLNSYDTKVKIINALQKSLGFLHKITNKITEDVLGEAET